MDASSNPGYKLSKSDSGLRIIPISDQYTSPFGLSEPLWIPDKECTHCRSCNDRFDFINRRHHCRRCGHCFCSRCCHYIKPLKRMYFVDPVRQCYDCAVVSTAENDFYEKSIHLLFAGTIMCLRNSCNINENVLCQLSSDHRFLQFKSQKAHGTSTSQMLSCPSSIMLDRISAVKFVTNPEGILNGINIEYSEDSSSPRITKLLELHTIESKLSISFMAALQKAVRLMFQSRSCEVL